MRILHTSDWHLGRALYGRRRHHEFAAFLDWLAEVIEARGVEALLLAGDVFDSVSPSPRAQELYYRFLGRMANSAVCGHVVVIAGNHDSPALLSAPGAILKALDIHVVGTLSESGQEEVLTLRDKDGSPRLIVAAVPYPRDRDLRDAAAGESPEDKERKLAEAVGEHYHRVGRLAEAAQAALDEKPPVVALGHLLAAGGQSVEGDGVRSLYIGSLGRMPVTIFPDVFDYVALGHLHQPQA
ncbi:MAG: exonuclease subunit SbcD, partial [Candidatus Adiutrix sp.]|nr:exonuclease subunit SbcD [Candidatus Adiutrix sp.]